MAVLTSFSMLQPSMLFAGPMVGRDESDVQGQ